LPDIGLDLVGQSVLDGRIVLSSTAVGRAAVRQP
jgi:hypothetical protein